LVCLSVYPHHNSKKNDPKVFKTGIANDDVVMGFKGQSQGHMVNKCIFTLITITPSQQHGVGSNSMSAF